MFPKPKHYAGEEPHVTKEREIVTQKVERDFVVFEKMMPPEVFKSIKIRAIHQCMQAYFDGRIAIIDRLGEYQKTLREMGGK